MNATQYDIDTVAAAILYEGYILYPYRPSLKNTQRWTFGGVYPRGYCERHVEDSCSIETQCLVETEGSAALDVRVRFLHLVDRSVAELTPPLAEWPAEGAPEHRRVPFLRVDGQRHECWQEAVEREIRVAKLPLEAVSSAPHEEAFAFPACSSIEPLFSDEQKRFAGALLRRQQEIAGSVRIAAERLGDGLLRLAVTIANETLLESGEQSTRDEATMQSLASTHTILSVNNGRFVSLIDPPERHRAAAAACRNRGAWPVLAGEPGQSRTMLSAPIILYDYPQVAPESPGDLFDATEIDEILSLRVLTLTDEEMQQMASVDQRTRALLQRTRGLRPEAMGGLHGTFRDLRPATEGAPR